jgi:hypothetical protein
VIGDGVDSFAPQFFGERINVAPADAVDDAGLALMPPDDV